MRCPSLSSALSLKQSNQILLIFMTIQLSLSNYTEINGVDGGENSATPRAANKTQLNSNKVSYEDIVTRGRRFNISSLDLIVLLHIQKTGGTAFERHLVEDLLIPKQCACNTERRRCNCARSNSTGNRTFADSTWLLSRFSTGWLCGLHPDWSSLNRCLGALDGLHFVTFLRDPIERFVSEFRHVQRGATWRMSRSQCKAYNTQLCYKGENWSNVTIEEFTNCKTNMAINRQTRMLANLDLTRCPDSSKTSDSPAHEMALLLSAMTNLRQMAFFGLCEEQRASQVIFERTFGLEFGRNFERSEDNKTRLMVAELPSDVKQKILEVNHLDISLYQFAVHLFWSRLQQLERLNLTTGS